jgi:predicted MFS family arabinose efflux permease
MNADAQALVLRALQFHNPKLEFAGADWEAVLAYCDRYQLTMPFARCVAGAALLPDWVRARLDGNLAANRIRVRDAVATYAALRERLAGIEHLVLKGFSLAPEFCPEAAARVQYDLDLYFASEDLIAARDAILTLGYEPLTGMEKFPIDHLPAMIRKTGWQWRGDFFDTSIPLSIEPHFRFWDRETERFGPNDLSGFWERRRIREGDVPFVSLSEADAITYACLHALRHLMRGDSRPAHFYEIGYFLERQRDPLFWEDWRAHQSAELLRIQAICFRFAQEWFGCTLPEVPASAVADLPETVCGWFEKWSRSPLESPFRPNKDELWLHLCLVDGLVDQVAVLRRRLFPVTMPGPVDSVHTPDAEMTFVLRVRRQWRFVAFVARRVWHHTRVLAPALWSGINWFFARQGMSGEFWRFYRGFVLFNVALMVFYLLYNLHLVSLGYKEDFIGKVASAMTTGSLAGSFVAGIAVSRIGLRLSLILCFVTQGIASALRVFASTPWPLLGFAFAAGVSHSFFAVSLAPAVAALTTEKNRPFAFSLTMSSGIALGILAGLAGGRLPALLHSTQNTLWVACALASIAAIPLLSLRKLGQISNPGLRTLLPSRFLVRFLAALSLWGFATGAFNPFFNVFFVRAMQYRVETIGLIFTASQFAQVVAMLLSPLILKRLGLMRGIASMQAATGLALAGLAFTNSMTAAVVYPLYMAFQYMSEPGIFSVLMSGVPEEQRTSASAWNFIVLFATHAAAAWIAGEAIARFGYPPVLIAAGLLALVAARAMNWVTPSR